MGPVDIAVSNSSRDNAGSLFASLEVAVVSKIPVRKVTKFDTRADSQSPVTIDENGVVTFRLAAALGETCPIKWSPKPRC
jgi:hypothetical protein